MHVEYLKKQIIFSLSSICSLYFFCFLVLIHSSISFLSLILNHILFFLALCFPILSPFSVSGLFHHVFTCVSICYSLHQFHHLSILILYLLCSFSSFAASVLRLLWLLFLSIYFQSHHSFVLVFFTVFLTVLLLTLLICLLISSSI